MTRGGAVGSALGSGVLRSDRDAVGSGVAQVDDGSSVRAAVAGGGSVGDYPMRRGEAGGAAVGGRMGRPHMDVVCRRTGWVSIQNFVEKRCTNHDAVLHTDSWVIGLFIKAHRVWLKFTVSDWVLPDCFWVVQVVKLCDFIEFYCIFTRFTPFHSDLISYWVLQLVWLLTLLFSFEKFECPERSKSIG